MGKAKSPPNPPPSVIVDERLLECPFREFKDSELSTELWGMGPFEMRLPRETKGKVQAQVPDTPWVDDQVQPLPRSVLRSVDKWVRAEDLSRNLYGDAELTVFTHEELDGERMHFKEIQLAHPLLKKSWFYRKVLSACYLLEYLDGYQVEHTWENFSFAAVSNSWRLKYHIYTPGMKWGGGPQHKPTLSKNGCYLVRLFYLGCWRCIWVDDSIPVDYEGVPLIPFAPPPKRTQIPTGKGKQAEAAAKPVVTLWPALICKALLKLAAPDQSFVGYCLSKFGHNKCSGTCDGDCDGDCLLADIDEFDDDPILKVDILHALTGSMNISFSFNKITRLRTDAIWTMLEKEVPIFEWDTDDDQSVNAAKKQAPKKPTNITTSVKQQQAMTVLELEDSKNAEPYTIPGLTPCHDMQIIVLMLRDKPLIRPPSEPEVPLWKTFRWVDWAKEHGLYDEYRCPRNRFIKFMGLMRQSYATHLFDVKSTESLMPRDRAKVTTMSTDEKYVSLKAEENEWCLFNDLRKYVYSVSFLYFTYCQQKVTTTNIPKPTIVEKGNAPRPDEVTYPSNVPLYLEVNSAETIILRISLNHLAARVLANCRYPTIPNWGTFLILEEFHWFENYKATEAPIFHLGTKGYNAGQIELPPGRYFFRVWVYSVSQWYVTMLSNAHLLLGLRSTIMQGMTREYPWLTAYLQRVNQAFLQFVRQPPAPRISLPEMIFYSSYKPDYQRERGPIPHIRDLHYKFRKALEKYLYKTLEPAEFQTLASALRPYFRDPHYGIVQHEDELPLMDASDDTHQSCDCEIKDENIEEEKHSMTTNYECPETISISSKFGCSLDDFDDPRNEAAIIIQKYWRGYVVRKMFDTMVPMSADALKILTDLFASTHAMGEVFNEFFSLHPLVKHAYTIGSCLNSFIEIKSYQGITHCTATDYWIPFFRGIFNCHSRVSVHVDLKSSLPIWSLSIYNLDTEKELPHVYSAHITYRLKPNDKGYAICGNAYKPKNAPVASLAWELVVMCSDRNAFHLCEGSTGECVEIDPSPISKLYLKDAYLPNKSFTIGRMLVNVADRCCASFRACVSDPEVHLAAILQTATDKDEHQEIARCTGIGVIYWQLILLHPPEVKEVDAEKDLQPIVQKKQSQSAKKAPQKDIKAETPNRTYEIVLLAPYGWPMTAEQWRLVAEYRDEVYKYSQRSKKGHGILVLPENDPSRAMAELEMAIITDPSVKASKNEDHLTKWLDALSKWNKNNPNRNDLGAVIRKQFRHMYLLQDTSPSLQAGDSEADGKRSTVDQNALETNSKEDEENGGEKLTDVQEEVEEIRYLQEPNEIKDKFRPLEFLDECTAAPSERRLLTPADELQQQKELEEAIEEANDHLESMRYHNLTCNLERQKKRLHKFEKFQISGEPSKELQEALQKREEQIIFLETQAALRKLSAKDVSVKSRKK